MTKHKALPALAACIAITACATPGELNASPARPGIAGTTIPALPPYRPPNSHAAPRSDPSSTP